MIGSATSDAPPVGTFWQAGKISLRCIQSSMLTSALYLRLPGLELKLDSAQPIAALGPFEHGSSTIRRATVKRTLERK